MISNKITPLLLSGFLFSVSSYASVSLSDAFNGFVPEEDRTKKWQEDMQQRFTHRVEESAALYDAVERHFAPLSRKTDDETRQQINAICDFLNHEYEKKHSQKIFFDGQLGNPELGVQGNMADKIVMGIGTKLNKEIEDLKKKKDNLLKSSSKQASSTEKNEEDQINMQNNVLEINKIDSQIKTLNEKIISNFFMKYLSWSNVYKGMTSLTNDKIVSISVNSYPEILNIVNNCVNTLNEKNQVKQRENVISQVLEKISKDFTSVFDELDKLPNHVRVNEVETSLKKTRTKLERPKEMAATMKTQYATDDALTLKELEKNIKSLDLVNVIKDKTSRYLKKLQN